MSKFPFKIIKFIYFLLGIFIFLFMVGGMLVYLPLIYISFIPLLIAIIYMIIKCKCPHCGKFENLDRFIYARKHVFYCRNCGRIIEIEE
ncbi:MAG TPA: hypothetical protein DC000_11060 [Clostridiales bacterium]|nr:hypothetical protein [Clostridiales bacterium]